MKEMGVGYNAGRTMGLLLGHMANTLAKLWIDVKLLQIPTCCRMNGLSIHWSRGLNALFCMRCILFNILQFRYSSWYDCISYAYLIELFDIFDGKAMKE